MKNKTNQSAIAEIKKLREGYAGKVLAWGQSDTEKWYETQLDLILSKELALAEQRGREEAIKEIGKQLQEKWDNDPRTEKDKKIKGSSAWRLGYLQALRDTSVDMRKLEKQNK